MHETFTISYEAGDYEAALSRAHLDVVRTGAGHGPNALVNVSLNGAEMFSGMIQFPVIGRTILADDVIAVAVIVAAPPGTRWCEIDLIAGDVLVYGPGAEHTGLSPEGVEYRFALIDSVMFEDATDALRTTIPCPAPGSVTRLAPTPAVAELSSQLLALGTPLSPRAEIPSTSVELIRSAARALREPSLGHHFHPSQRIQSRAVVTACVDFVDTLGRTPSIAEMCLASHVSERRLRSAFNDTFDQPPSEFFRVRLLNRAHAALRTGDQSVTQVALDLGFNHLGRFAQQYAHVYGEYPSDTLANSREPLAHA